MNISITVKRQGCTIFTENSYYIILYNLIQLFGYSSVVVRIVYELVFGSGNGNAFDWVGVTIMLIQSGTFMEIIHSKIGVAKEKLLPIVGMTLGRNFVLFGLLLQEKRLHDDPTVCLLFMVWSVSEIIRYLYHWLDCGNIKVDMVTWLYHTAWIPLCPLEILLEGAIVMNAIPYFRQTGIFTVTVPYSTTPLFYFPWFLYAYLGIMPIATFYVMVHTFFRRIEMMGYPGTRPKTF